jgi:hypothetical protein
MAGARGVGSLIMAMPIHESFKHGRTVEAFQQNVGAVIAKIPLGRGAVHPPNMSSAEEIEAAHRRVRHRCRISIKVVQQ